MTTTIKLGFVDTFDTAIEFFTSVLSRRYVIERNDQNPEILIFGDPNFGERHYQYRNCKKILYTGENFRPTFFMYDYAMTFDHINSPNHYRLPLYVLEMWSIANEQNSIWTNDPYYLVNKSLQKHDVEKLYDERKGISYVQKNPNCQFRTQFMEYLLQTVKDIPIVCGGTHLNNIGRIIPRPGGHSDKINFISQYRFNVAFENGAYPGYVTEKLLNAFYANTIPIYWGSANVFKDFNSKAYIDAQLLKSADEIIDRIREIDSNKNLYCEMLSEPAFIDNRINDCTNIDNLLRWFDKNIVER